MPSYLYDIDGYIIYSNWEFLTNKYGYRTGCVDFYLLNWRLNANFAYVKHPDGKVSFKLDSVCWQY